MSLVASGLCPEGCLQGERERVEFGEQLKASIASFTTDFIPHMDEEEEVSSARGQGRSLSSPRVPRVREPAMCGLVAASAAQECTRLKA